jgi:ribosomal 50S subunit-recycling heat shock protein
MRLDQFLKVSRLLKQRSVAKWACDAGRVDVAGRQAKAGTIVREGDELTLRLRDRTLRVKVLSVPSGNVDRERARTLYELIEEREVSEEI